MDESINIATREHEECVQDWRYSQVSKLLYQWYDLLNPRFFGSQVPTPVLSFRRTRRRVMGRYVLGRNEIAVKENININTAHLADPLAEILATLAHEMTHAWQENYGRSSKGRYHNRQFRDKTAEIGIPSNQWGVSLGMTDPFVAFLREHGVEANTYLEMPKITREVKSGRRLKRWFCGCTKVWAACEVQARCLRCGGRFEHSCA